MLARGPTMVHYTLCIESVWVARYERMLPSETRLSLLKNLLIPKSELVVSLILVKQGTGANSILFKSE